MNPWVFIHHLVHDVGNTVETRTSLPNSRAFKYQSVDLMFSYFQVGNLVEVWIVQTIIRLVYANKYLNISYPEPDIRYAQFDFQGSQPQKGGVKYGVDVCFILSHNTAQTPQKCLGEGEPV